jgi:hypothetical protein
MSNTRTYRLGVLTILVVVLGTVAPAVGATPASADALEGHVTEE